LARSYSTGNTCSAIGELKKLRLLNMMGNKLISLPEGVCQLTNLYRLGLKGNQLQALPDSFGNLQNLVELFLTDNALKTLPVSLQGCTALVKLQVCAVLTFLYFLWRMMKLLISP
jgi:Leucine-rich repeat (LRR) protein